MSQAMTDSKRGEAPELTPREARDRYLDHRKVDAADASVRSWRYRLKHFVEWVEERDEIRHISELNGWLIDSYANHRRGEDLAAVTLNSELQTIKNWFEYLARIGVVDAGLPDLVDVPEIPDGEESNDEMLEPERALAILDYYRNSSEKRATVKHTFLELLWFTGCRMGAARALDLEDYHSDEQYITFRHRDGTPLKNDTDGERAVGLSSTVCDVLDEYIANYREDSHDSDGRKPLINSSAGRPAKNTLRVWCYLATQPCLYLDCPHGRERDSCDYVQVHHASKCPSSVSPHRVRTGSITWQRDRGLPAEVVAERVNASLEVIEQYYDMASERERLENRRRPYLSNLEMTDNE